MVHFNAVCHGDRKVSDTEPGPSDPRIAEPGDACPNCGTRLLGRWCYACGQNQRSIHRVFFALVAEALEDVFAWNSRTGRTLVGLFFRPGFLANEFFEGRRARYLPPLRLYIVTSVLFFFLLSVENMLGDPAAAIVLPGDDQAVTDEGETTSSWRDQIDTTDLRLSIPWLEESSRVALEERLSKQLDKLAARADEDPGEIFELLLDVTPPVIFLLLPFFALLLKLFYFSFGFYYVEHLVLAIINHSFLFAALLVDNVLETMPIWGTTQLSIAILIWIPIYMYLSLKNVYGQGWFATLINYFLLVFFYFTLLAIGVAIAILLGVMAL